MSFPTIPNITPSIGVTPGQAINLLLSSIALEEFSLAHIMNAEAEKIQFVLGTLVGPTGAPIAGPTAVTISDLINIDSDVRRTLENVIKKEMLLQFKLENVIDAIPLLSGL